MPSVSLPMTFTIAGGAPRILGLFPLMRHPVFTWRGSGLLRVERKKGTTSSSLCDGRNRPRKPPSFSSAQPALGSPTTPHPSARRFLPARWSGPGATEIRTLKHRPTRAIETTVRASPPTNLVCACHGPWPGPPCITARPVPATVISCAANGSCRSGWRNPGTRLTSHRTSTCIRTPACFRAIKPF